jgi:hypothetical protein
MNMLNYEQDEHAWAFAAIRDHVKTNAIRRMTRSLIRHRCNNSIALLRLKSRQSSEHTTHWTPLTQDRGRLSLAVRRE